MATHSLSDLISVLGEKVGTLESLVDILKEEQRFIVEARTEQLNENTRLALASISTMNILNGRFRELLVKTGSEFGLSETGSLTDLFPGVDPESCLALKRLQKRCFTAVDTINRLLAMNEGLIRNSLNIIDRSISLFGRLLGGCETYGSAGRMRKGRAQAGMFCREI